MKKISTCTEMFVVKMDLQQTQLPVALELHAVCLGEIAFATNPFELYIDYTTQMRGRSRATQTFLVQLAGNSGYLPGARSIAHKGYSSTPATTIVGAEGGDKLVEWTVKTINQMWCDLTR